MGILLTSIFVLSVMPIIPFIIVYFITYYLKKDGRAPEYWTL
ncbi:hypothetical protein NYE70_08885 [Paenibacillus sp. FSL R5-0407]